jgi:5-methylcytosine-specific restriction enzyme subunit McrC
MAKQPLISVFEYGFLQVGERYNDVEFTPSLYKELAQYLTANKNCGYYSLLYNRVRFTNYVGVIKIGDVTIEILPKIERAEGDEKIWRNVLIKMLYISLQVEANTTTLANIDVNQQSVLATYINLFLNETESLLHKGLIKKYRKEAGNKTALKGKIVFSEHLRYNLTHAERFFVEYNEYNKDNIYNFLLRAAVECIIKIDPSFYLSNKAKSLLDIMPECTPVKVSESLFSKITHDRKTEHYKTALELARIILLNYHPDVKSGSNNILAIMFDMNLLWENYMYYVLRRAGSEVGVNVYSQKRKLFWHHEHDWDLNLKPDLVLERGGKKVVIDTKWKYDSKISIQDIRQLYSYGDYFDAKINYLLYPDKHDNAPVIVEKGTFYSHSDKNELIDKWCSLMFADILLQGNLNLEIGNRIIEECLI